MFVPYDDYIDLDSDLWKDVKAANDAMVWNDKHYMAIVEVTGDQCAIIYNRKTMDENGLDDPAELFEKGKWDWDAFEDMLSEFVDTSDERYGIDGIMIGRATYGRPWIFKEICPLPPVFPISDWKTASW
jgi:multiple sugar transport system substrate-binding protein